MAILTKKFSEFTDGGDLSNDKITVGLGVGGNTQYNNPWTFLPPGTTAERPAITAAMYYRLRLNTTTEEYEFYDPTLAVWTSIEDSQNVLPLLASHTAGEGASLIGLQNQGAVVNKFVQDLANATLIAQTDNGSIANGQFLDDLASGFVTVTTGTGILSSTTVFPVTPGTLNHLLRSNGTSWVQTTATTLDASDVLSGLTQLNVDNLRLDGNTFSTTDTNGNIVFTPNGTGGTLIGASTSITGLSRSLQIATSGSSPLLVLGSYVNTTGAFQERFYKSRSTTIGVFATVNSGDQLGQVQFYGDDGAAFRQSVNITATTQGSISSGVVPGQLVIQTANTSGTLTTALTISNAQEATFANAVTATAGIVTSGATGGGFIGQFQAFSTGASLGSLSLTAANSAGNFANVLTNASTAAARTWTLPDASGTIALTSGASGIVNSGTQNQLTWYAATGTTVSGLATANNGILVTSAGGVPSIGNTIGASISVTGTVTGTTGVSTGVSGTSSGTTTSFTDNAAGNSPAQVYQISKSVPGAIPVTFLQITVPAGVYFIAIECFISVSRAALNATVGTSFVERKYFAIARNGSGTDVVLDGDATFAANIFITTTTTAGGANSATSGATTIARNGAEANTAPQVVNITVNPTCGGASGIALIFSTINVLGSATGLVIA